MDYQDDVPGPVHEGWSLVDRKLDEVHSQLDSASTEEQFQAVGLLCRETLIALTQTVFEPDRHPPVDNVDVSKTDAKRMLEGYLAAELKGGSNEIPRKYAKASVDLANYLQHKATATFRQAAICAEATNSVVRLVNILEGRSGTGFPTVIDKFKTKLMDYRNWQYDGISRAVYLLNPDYTIEIEETKPEYGTGNYWWGNLLYEKPSLSSYNLRCKGETVRELLVVHFRDECLTIPFPSVKTTTDPWDGQSNTQGIDFYGDVFYYTKDSLEFSLLYHIRMMVPSRQHMALTVPIESQLKPRIIRLPFVFLEDDSEVNDLTDEIKQRILEFVRMKEKMEQDSNESDEEHERMMVERRFSEWVFELWESQQRSQV